MSRLGCQIAGGVLLYLAGANGMAKNLESFVSLLGP
jgi:hypothetical protein